MSNKAKIIILSSIGIMIVIVSFLLFKPLQHLIYQHIRGSSNYVIQGNHNNIISSDVRNHYAINSIKELKPVKSEFKLPHYLLQRRDIINSILERFENNSGITTVALAGIVGLGGVGKTTIARMIGKYWEENYPHSHVYEINAETETTIANSFMDFAISLAQTNALKEELGYIKQISDPQQKAKELTHFVQNILKKSSKWLIVFDNVDSKKDIELYFPYDANIWGNGHIIITTRNDNIIDDECLDTRDIIHIDQLAESEAFELFTTVYNHHHKNMTDEEILQIKQFLKEMPPFPHDINIAAKYIRNHNMVLADYLQLMRQQTQKFHESQEEFIKDISEYNKSRYQIIALSLTQILKKDDKYQELLLLLSLLDSQDVPKELLEFCSDKLTTNNFLHELHRYSLITQGGKYDIPTISMHRSTQEIISSYINEVIKMSYNLQMFNIVLKSLEDYFINIIDQENLIKMRFFENHCTKILQYKFYLNDYTQGIWNCIIGCIYYYLGDAHYAKTFLLKGLSDKTINSFWYAKASSHLGIVLTKFEEYEKAKFYLKTAVLQYRKDVFLVDKKGFAKSLIYLSNYYLCYKNYRKAKKLLKQSLILLNSSDSYLNNKAFALVYLAKIYIEQEKWQHAKKKLKLALAINNENNKILGWRLGYLSIVYKELGQYERALNILKLAISNYLTHDILSQHSIIGWLMIHMGEIYSIMGNYEEADKVLKDASNYFKFSYPKNMTYYYEFIIKLKLKTGNYGLAKELLNQYYLTDKKGVRSKYKFLKGVLYLLQEQYFEAENLLKSHFDTSENLLYNSLKWFEIQIHLARTCCFQQKYDEAELLLKKALAKYQDHFGKDHLRTAEILRYLGDLYLAQAKFDLAEEFLQHSLKILKDNNNHPDRFLVYESLAALEQNKAEQYQCNNDIKNSYSSWDQAQQYLKQALQIAEATFPSDSAHIARLKDKSLTMVTPKAATIPSYNFLYYANYHFMP